MKEKKLATGHSTTSLSSQHKLFLVVSLSQAQEHSLKNRNSRQITGGIINSHRKQAASLRAARRLLLSFQAAQPIKLPSWLPFAYVFAED